jgi:CheY-like chemotaxis protein
MVTGVHKQIHILLAEDDADDREFFEEALHASDVNGALKAVSDGEMLIKYLNGDNELPDVVFMDINMPCINGIDCLKLMRSSEKLRHIPVVIFTTSSYEKDIEDAYNAGANLFVCKRVFFNDEVLMLKKIFARNWRSRLNMPGRDHFVFEQIAA